MLESARRSFELQMEIVEPPCMTEKKMQSEMNDGMMK
jgi:hypothetical protein